MSMSVAMAQGLNNLLTVNSQLGSLQTQLTTGKKINNASDGLAAFLTSNAYTDRASRLTSVNNTITQNMMTIKSASTALNSIKSNLQSTLDTLKSASLTTAYAAAVAATDTAAVSTTSATQIALTFNMRDANGNPIQTKIDGATKLVKPFTDPNKTTADDPTGTLRIGGSSLSDGQIFKINDTYIKIAATVTGANGDGKEATPKQVTTVAELLAAMKDALGAGYTDNSNTVAGANGLNGVAILLSGDDTSAKGAKVSIQQTAGNAANLGGMFQSGRPKAVNAKQNYTSDDLTYTSNPGDKYTAFTLQSMDHTVTGAVPAQNADPLRAAAVKAYAAAMDQINQYFQSASVGGVNLLNGDKIQMFTDEKGSTSTYQLQNLNNTAMSFSAAALNLVAPGTGASVDTVNNFATNANQYAAIDPTTGNTVGLNNAIAKLTNALATVALGTNQMAAFQNAVQNRSDFNNSMISMLNDAANNLTAVDSTAVAAQVASLQTQQSFAQSIMSNTKQADQSILQLLR
jgi:flagellin